MGSRFVRIASLAVAAILGLAAAQGDASLDAAFSVGTGRFLVDGDGRALYAFLEDQQGASTCSGACAETWPPLTTESGVSVGGSLDGGLVGTMPRDGGATQVTYAGWPLYRFAEDEGPGSTAGQGANDAWFLVAPDGTLIGADDAGGPVTEAEATGDTADAGEAEDAAPNADSNQMAAGRRIYEQAASPACASCHAPDGTGGAGPSLIGASRLSSPPRSVAQIVDGGHMMPGYGEQLSDAEIAAVLTYVSNSWGNDYGALSAQEVSDLR